VVVAGLALGIDTAAHASAVEAGGLTWAVLPSALDSIYPAANQALAARIVDTGGALVSEYPPGTRVRRTLFVERDRLQAALADAVLVIETGRTGGTQHTIRYARALDTPVWTTLPDEVLAGGQTAGELPVAQQGTWDLWRSGAAVLTPADLAARVRASRQRPAPVGEGPAQAQLF
jgi:predicted Rossmann fold nucleotide-binding protein DprA/Smf involved in DNA uptake